MVFRAVDAVNDLRPCATARSEGERVIDSVRRTEPLAAKRSDGEVWPSRDASPPRFQSWICVTVSTAMRDFLTRVTFPDACSQRAERAVTETFTCIRNAIFALSGVPFVGVHPCSCSICCEALIGLTLGCPF